MVAKFDHGRERHEYYQHVGASRLHSDACCQGHLSKGFLLERAPPTQASNPSFSKLFCIGKRLLQTRRWNHNFQIRCLLELQLQANLQSITFHVVLYLKGLPQPALKTISCQLNIKYLRRGPRVRFQYIIIL